MSFEKIKTEINEIIAAYYEQGTDICDIRAALHAADMQAEQLMAIEMMSQAEMYIGTKGE